MKGIWKYSHLLPHVEESCKITLGEGGTPLIRSKRIGSMIGLENLYFKLEMINPSGSYKDRFAAVAISDLLQKDVKFCLATSSGNTGAALAAYCAAANIKCLLAIVDGAPIGKMKQMQVYGCQTLMIKGFGKDMEVTKGLMSDLKGLANKYKTEIQISAYRYSPTGMAGVQTIAYEIAESMTNKTDHVFSPSGGGGLTLAVIKGFTSWKKFSPGFRVPKVHSVQPTGNDTISGPLRNGFTGAREILKSTTSVSGLQVPNVLDGHELIMMSKVINATGYAVSDASIYECQELLAKYEGIFCEPAGAVALAGLKLALQRVEIEKDDHVVCIVTGHGFKDPVSADKISKGAVDCFFQDREESIAYIEDQINQLQI